VVWCGLCLQEELGLDPACVRVVACLPPFLSKHLLSVTPVVGVIPAHLRFTPNPTEVRQLTWFPCWGACVHGWVPAARLCLAADQRCSRGANQRCSRHAIQRCSRGANRRAPCQPASQPALAAVLAPFVTCSFLHLPSHCHCSQVEAVFTAPLKRFLEAGPTYSSRDVEWEPGVPYRLHYFQHTADSGATYCIWGLTAGEFPSWYPSVSF
jgi:hypothetical protein